MQKTSPLLLITGLVLIVSACVPNRLSSSLTTREAAKADAGATAPAAPAPSGKNLQPQLGNANINLAEVVTLLPPDAIPAVLPENAPAIMITAAEADEAGIASNTRVLGVSINGDSRAYPIPYMSEHEIVNDEVGGQLIAATW